MKDFIDYTILLVLLIVIFLLQLIIYGRVEELIYYNLIDDKQN
jgi:hypothetical protein